MTLFCSEYPVTCIAEARNDIRILVKPFVLGSDIDINIRMRFGQSLPIEGARAFPNRLQYSAESGYAIDLIRSGPNRVVFQRFLPDSGFEVLNDYWAFDLENGTPVRLTYDTCIV